MKVWILAARPKTLPAAISPILIGIALAFREGTFEKVPAMLCLFFAILVQIGANFANDYFDHAKGADTEDRIGPTRAVAAGLVDPLLMRQAFCAVFLLAFVVGCGLIYYGGLWLLAVGIASILSGIAYTGGPFPFGYHGLGDLFVFLFFGIIAVSVTFYTQAGYFSVISLLPATAAGSLVTNILVVNNFRDIDSDRQAGKSTLAVQFGQNFSLREYQVNCLIALVVPIVLWRLGFGPWMLLPIVCWPWSLVLRRRLQEFRGNQLNQVLADSAQFLFLYSILLSIGIALGR